MHIYIYIDIVMFPVLTNRGMERDQISDIRPPTNQISDIKVPPFHPPPPPAPTTNPHRHELKYIFENDMLFEP